MCTSLGNTDPVLAPKAEGGVRRNGLVLFFPSPCFPMPKAEGDSCRLFYSEVEKTSAADGVPRNSLATVM